MHLKFNGSDKQKPLIFKGFACPCKNKFNPETAALGERGFSITLVEYES